MNRHIDLLKIRLKKCGPFMAVYRRLRNVKDAVCERHKAAKRKKDVKIDSFTALLQAFSQKVYKAQRIMLEETVRSCDMYSGKKVLLISHEADLTGAPIALEHLAEHFAREGWQPIFLSPKDGSLAGELERANIPFIASKDAYDSSLVRCCAHLFDAIVVNTAVGAPVIQMLSGMDVPVLWWIHESKASYSPWQIHLLPEKLESNIRVYAVGEYAHAQLKKVRPLYAAEKLLYYIPDYAKQKEEGILLEHAGSKMIFGCVGTLEERKGHGVMAQAIRMMPEKERSESLFVFIGRQCDPACYEHVQALVHDYPDNVVYFEHLSRKEMMKLYRQMDCLVCASLDDPMPIVVTEALQFQKLVVCSEHTGSAALLKENSSGLVYRHDDPRELMNCILKIMREKDQMEDIRSAARLTYEKYFSMEAFERQVNGVIRSLGEKCVRH